MEIKNSLIGKLSILLNKLPNIGPRQAKRLSYFLARYDPKILDEIAKLFWDISKKIGICDSCNFIFEREGKNQKLCPICSDSKRIKKFICVVEKDTDLISIEKTGKYKGIYYVLGGLANSFEGDIDKNFNLKPLIARIKNSIANKEPIEEIILALNLTSEGYLTTGEIKKQLIPYGIKVTQLGVGLPIGSEVEFADSETLIESFKNRN